jgi:hypothetical protein
MADGVPYISANSGLPSIKINGVVEPYGNPDQLEFILRLCWSDVRCRGGTFRTSPYN